MQGAAAWPGADVARRLQSQDVCFSLGGLRVCVCAMDWIHDARRPVRGCRSTLADFGGDSHTVHRAGSLHDAHVRYVWGCGSWAPLASVARHEDRLLQFLKWKRHQLRSGGSRPARILPRARCELYARPPQRHAPSHHQGYYQDTKGLQRHPQAHAHLAPLLRTPHEPMWIRF